MIQSLLIANRGEIVSRIARTCNVLGIRSIAIYSDADAHLPFLGSCDDAFPLGGDESKETYLHSEKILQIAKESGAQAIHPGYGFLSENASFAQSVITHKLLFVGPRPQTILQMGSKIEAKKIAHGLGIPTVPGITVSSLTDKKTLEAIVSLGLPVLIKASAGGGGRGMRIVRTQDELLSSLKSASREAEAFFNDGTLFVEKLIEGARHIEVQIFGSKDGDVWHFGTRDCTLQRNHQKVIEEAPAPGLSSTLRTTLEEAAVKIGKAVQYENAGTVEFLIVGETFYFLEVNSRLQVEHPVTELIYNTDLVEVQLRLASGETLKTIFPKGLSSGGHAIQARVCAEVPRDNFRSDTGFISDWVIPSAARVDTGYGSQSNVTHYYDSLLAKTIVHSSNRSQAIKEMIASLGELLITGVLTNTEYLLSLLNDNDFAQATHTLQTPPGVLSAMEHSIVPYKAILASLLLPHYQEFEQTIGFRLSGLAQRSVRCSVNGQRLSPHFIFYENGSIFEQSLKCELFLKDILKDWKLVSTGDTFWAQSKEGIFAVQFEKHPLRAATNDSRIESYTISSPLPGKLIEFLVTPGKKITSGDTVAVIESMKMEHIIRAPTSGTVTSASKQKGQIVQKGEALVVISGKDS